MLNTKLATTIRPGDLGTSTDWPKRASACPIITAGPHRSGTRCRTCHGPASANWA